MTPLPKLAFALAAVRQQYRQAAAAMRTAGHKQEYIAAVIGVPQGTVSRWLRGRTR